MYVESVTMTDFRCFENVTVTFVHINDVISDETLRNVTLLMGINGAGKTSTLKAVALGLMTPIINHMGYTPYALVRRSGGKKGPSVATVEILGRSIPGHVEAYSVERDVELLRSRMQVTITKPDPKSFLDLVTGQHLTSNEVLSESYTDESSDRVFVLGYGASRRTEYLENLDSQRSRRRLPRFQRVAGLFEEFITLIPLAAWFPTLKSKSYKSEVCTLLNRLLPGGVEFSGEFKDAEALFDHDGVRLPFGALSDGYRSYAGLIADMLYHLNYVCPKRTKLTDIPGVVMIDDIDVHLHPAWQREVVPKLATTFPKLQFIITSHSPLVAGTLHAANIRVIEDNQIRQLDESVSGKSADQLLLSPYFGLSSPRSPAAEKKLKKKATRVADTHDPAEAVAFLKELAAKNGAAE